MNKAITVTVRRLPITLWDRAMVDVGFHGKREKVDEILGKFFDVYKTTRSVDDVYKTYLSESYEEEFGMFGECKRMNIRMSVSMFSKLNLLSTRMKVNGKVKSLSNQDIIVLAFVVMG